MPAWFPAAAGGGVSDWLRTQQLLIADKLGLSDNEWSAEEYVMPGDRAKIVITGVNSGAFSANGTDENGSIKMTTGATPASTLRLLPYGTVANVVHLGSANNKWGLAWRDVYTTVPDSQTLLQMGVFRNNSTLNIALVIDGAVDEANWYFRVKGKADVNLGVNDRIPHNWLLLWDGTDAFCYRDGVLVGTTLAPTLEDNPGWVYLFIGNGTTAAAQTNELPLFTFVTKKGDVS